MAHLNRGKNHNTSADQARMTALFDGFPTRHPAQTVLADRPIGQCAGSGRWRPIFFAAAIRCPALIRWRVLEAGHDNALVWSRKHISLNAALICARDGVVLWRARSTASRSSGDVPLSLFSLPLGCCAPPHSRVMTTPSPPCWTTWPAACWPVCRICVRCLGFGQQGKGAQDVRYADRRGRREMRRRQLV